jgi:hypothetical protein
MYFDIEEQIENNFEKINEILRFAAGGRVLIANSNARSKTWHDVKTNPRGRKMEFLAGNQLHIVNEESERYTFNNTRGFSNIDLTITNNNLIEAIGDCEISAEESLSDHNYLKYKIGLEGTNSLNVNNKRQGPKYILKENKVQEFDRNLIQEMWKMAKNKNIERRAEELDKYLSTIITKENDLERYIDLFS